MKRYQVFVGGKITSKLIVTAIVLYDARGKKLLHWRYDPEGRFPFPPVISFNSEGLFFNGEFWPSQVACYKVGLRVPGSHGEREEVFLPGGKLFLLGI